MIAADRPVQRPPDARMLVVDERGRVTHARREDFIHFLRPGDLVVANDAATLPASLHGVHRRTGAVIEVRLAGSPSLMTGPGAHGCGAEPHSMMFTAVVFGPGDFRTRTEHRLPPPPLIRGDRLEFGSLVAAVRDVLDHPRLIALRFHGSAAEVWAGLARAGRPIQYAHMAIPLQLWDVWAPIAASPVAFEAPSASFVMDWRHVAALREQGIDFATVTVAAGISSTGDEELDKRLPFDEPYRIPKATADAIAARRGTNGRVIAVGTTVVRALEHSAMVDGQVPSGDAVATGRIGRGSTLRVVDAILSGTHEPGVSHYELLRAFADDDTLAAATAGLEAFGYRTHEFGDSTLVFRADRRRRARSNDRTARSDGGKNHRFEPERPQRSLNLESKDEPLLE